MSGGGGYGELVEGERGKSIVVQLDAYALPDDHTVWKCSPGKTYRFYTAVRDAYTVFPDIRGLTELGGGPSEWTLESLLQAVSNDRWERELERMARGRSPQSQPGITKADKEKLTFARRIWFEAKKGDLVVIPAEGYDKEVLIGELLTEPGDLRWIDAKDGEFEGKYIGRPVAWKRSIPKFQLNEDLIKALHTRAAVFPLRESRKEDVYRLAYRNFVYKGNYVAEFHTEKERFTAEDSAVVSTWLNGFDYLRHVLSETGVDNLPAQMSFYQMGLEPVPDSDSAELKINIQSPGEIFVKTFGPFALALMCMLPLSACSPQAVIDNNVTIEMNYVGNADASCEVLVRDTVKSMVGTMSYNRLDEANCLGVRAMNDAQLSTRAHLKNQPETSN